MQLDVARRPRRAISLTPLIDVVFILLLFFMLTTQFGSKQGLAISVPGNSTETASAAVEQLRINLLSDGTVEVNELLPISLTGIRSNSQVMNARDKALVVIVNSEEDVDLQTFTKLMDTLSQLGFYNVSVQGLR